MIGLKPGRNRSERQNMICANNSRPDVWMWLLWILVVVISPGWLCPLSIAAPGAARPKAERKLKRELLAWHEIVSC